MFVALFATHELIRAHRFEVIKERNFKSMKKIFYILSVLVLVTLTSCDPVEFGFSLLAGAGGNGNPTRVGPPMMMVPIYERDEEVMLKSPRTANELSRIYSYPPLVFMVEKEEGLHIIDNQDPKAPQNIKFLSIPGLKDVEFRENICYASTTARLMAIELQADTAIILQQFFLQGARAGFSDFPPNYSGYFVCPHPERTVIGWKQEEMNEKPNCRK